MIQDNRASQITVWDTPRREIYGRKTKIIARLQWAEEIRLWYPFTESFGFTCYGEEISNNFAVPSWQIYERNFDVVKYI